ARVAETNKMSLTEFRRALERDGIQFDRFREEVRIEMMLSRLREREVDARIAVTDNEIDYFLSEQGAPQNSASEYDLSHILVRLPEQASPEQVEKQRARAEQVLLQLREGADFAKLAVAFSDAPDALQGGAMGWRARDRLPELFAHALDGMKPGEVSGIVRSPAGFHVIKLIEVRGGAAFGELAKLNSDDVSSIRSGDLGWLYPGDTVPEFERTMNSLKVGELSEPFASPFGWHLMEVLERRKADVSGQRERKADEAYQEWLRQLRDRAFVEYRLDER